jgi:hypothetical protein
MKKFTLLFSLVFLSAFSFAQWSYGPRIGLNFSTVSGQWWSDEGDHYWITGFEAGAVGNYAMNDNFSVGAELLYITSGVKYEWLLEDEASRSVNSSSDAYWIERYGNLRIPIYAKYMMGDKFKYYGIIGPYFNFVLCGKYKDVIESRDYEQKGKIKFGDEPENYDGDDWYINSSGYYNVRRFDIGMYFGIGGQRELGSGSLGVEFRAGLGLIDTYNFDNNDDKNDDYKPYKNRNLTLSFLYTLPCEK